MDNDKYLSNNSLNDNMIKIQKIDKNIKNKTQLLLIKELISHLTFIPK